MFLLAGLGNPGLQHAKQRHNVGFMAADNVWHDHGFSPWKQKFHSQVAEGKLAGEKTLLVKPTTFMNESGRAIGEIARFYKINGSEILVMYDELDLPAAKLRIKSGGGHGGHNGIRSIEAHIGKDFRRMRIGIGHPGNKAKVHNYVLGDFAKADQSWLKPLLDAISHNAPDLARGQDSSVMNKIHLATAPTTPSPKKPAKQKSHIHQARRAKVETPKSGPMADMLKKILGNNND